MLEKETFAPSKIAIETAYFDLRLQIATTTDLLDFRYQLHSQTSPMFVASWAVKGWVGNRGKTCTEK